MSQGQWWAEVGQWQELQEAEQAERDRLAALTDKWPGLKAWPGKEKSPVLPSGNGPGFEPQSNRT